MLLEADVGSGHSHAALDDGCRLLHDACRSGLGTCGQHVGEACGLRGILAVLIQGEGHGIHGTLQVHLRGGCESHGFHGDGIQRLGILQQLRLGRAHEHVGLQDLP